MTYLSLTEAKNIIGTVIDANSEPFVENACLTYLQLIDDAINGFIHTSTNLTLNPGLGICRTVATQMLINIYQTQRSIQRNNPVENTTQQYTNNMFQLNRLQQAMLTPHIQNTKVIPRGYRN